MANWAEARKQAEHLGNFLKKLTDAEEIFVKAAQAEDAIPKLVKELKAAEDDASIRFKEAKEVKEDSETAMNKMKQAASHASDKVKMVESRLRDLTSFYDTQIKEEQERASKTIDSMNRNVEDVSAESKHEVNRLKDEVKMWEDKLKLAASAHQMFIKSVTG